MPATLDPAPVTDSQPPKRYTPEDLLALADRGRDYELVGGALVEVPVSYLSSWVAGEVHRQLANHVRPRRLGWVAPEGTSFRCFADEPDKVRRADTAYHALARLSYEQATTDGHCRVVPDLAVEVVSPNDLADDVEDKRVEWLEAGARLVWVVHPVRRTVHVHTADGASRVFGPADELTADPVLPDFRCPVADLFALPTGAG